MVKQIRAVLVGGALLLVACRLLRFQLSTTVDFYQLTDNGNTGDGDPGRLGRYQLSMSCLGLDPGQ